MEELRAAIDNMRQELDQLWRIVNDRDERIARLEDEIAELKLAAKPRPGAPDKPY